jgi:peptidoglycan/xylan/chitin deacetylase (PgdA/CDA1 family)
MTAASTRPIPVVLTIDAEPDHPWPPLDKRDPWLGFEGWLEYVPELRDHLERATGRPAAFTLALRMDEQIARVYGDPAWAADTYGPQLDAMTAAGDELGLHPHAWRWQDPPGRWLQDHADDALVEEVIAGSFEAYRNAFGRDCRVHRFGSRFVSAGIVSQLKALGVRVDTTVEPGARGMAALEKSVVSTGWLPDQGHAPRIPYRPADGDPFSPATGGTNDGTELWMLPATSFDPAPWLPAWRRAARRIRFAGRPRHRPAEIWAPVDADRFWDLATASATALATPYLSLAMRSDCMIRPELSVWVRDKLDRLVDAPIAKRLAFVTTTEAIAALTGDQ